MAYLDTESDLDQPWHAVGLGTPAGNALFRLYGGRRAQNAGNQFSAHNMARLATMPPAAPKMEALPQTRKKVSVPRPTGRRDTGEIDDIPRMRRYNFTGKKSVATIEMEQASAEPVVPPRPSGPLLDDREKERCAALMRFRGKLPEPIPRKVKRRNRTEREELEAMFASIQAEIDEREAWLAEMAVHDVARAAKYQSQIQGEVQTRVAELKRIDAMLDTLDAQAGVGGALSLSGTGFSQN